MGIKIESDNEPTQNETVLKHLTSPYIFKSVWAHPEARNPNIIIITIIVNITNLIPFIIQLL